MSSRTHITNAGLKNFSQALGHLPNLEHLSVSLAELYYFITLI